MKKTSPRQRGRKSRASDELRPEYDFRGGVRGKYVARYREGTNVVVLDPDVAEAFADAKAVNRALRALLEVTPPRRGRARRSRTA
ncbi:MAG: hypothetical protein ACREOF_06460 [Gemmatimonadales bacterium]